MTTCRYYQAGRWGSTPSLGHSQLQRWVSHEVVVLLPYDQKRLKSQLVNAKNRVFGGDVGNWVVPRRPPRSSKSTVVFLINWDNRSSWLNVGHRLLWSTEYLCDNGRRSKLGRGGLGAASILDWWVGEQGHLDKSLKLRQIIRNSADPISIYCTNRRYEANIGQLQYNIPT